MVVPRGIRVKQAYRISGLLAIFAYSLCSATAQAGHQGLPRPDHVVVVVMENHGYSSIVESPHAPFTNSLVARGALFTQSYGVTHPSQPNYLALFSGSVQGVEGNTCPHRFTTPNLGAVLLQAGLSFAGYAEDLPETGSTVCVTGPYVRKHNPWVNWQHSGPFGLPGSVNQPFSGFPSDYSQLPTVSFVIPNGANDMHDGSDPERIRRGDAWLRTHLSDYVEWAHTHNSLLVLTWDEDDGQEGNRIPTILVGPMVRPSRSSQRITHLNVLRTLENLYGLPQTLVAPDIQPMQDVWTSGPAPAHPSVCAGQDGRTPRPSK